MFSYFLNDTSKCPEELTCQDVRDFLLAKKDSGLKATTLNLYNSAIHFFYRNVLHILWDDTIVPRMITERKLRLSLLLMRSTVCWMLLATLNTGLCLQLCILPGCGFPK